MLEANYRYKMRHSPDYADVDLPAALSDFRMRIKKYEAAYQPIADRSLHYIKARVRGRGRGWWCVCACVACCAALCAGEAAPPPARQHTPFLGERRSLDPPQNKRTLTHAPTNQQPHNQLTDMVTGRGHLDINRISGYIPGKIIFYLLQVGAGQGEGCVCVRVLCVCVCVPGRWL